MIHFESENVGKRWFQVEVYQDHIKNTDPRIPDQLIGEVEASYSNHGGKWLGPGNGFGKPGRNWKITGKGSKKYRQQIIDHLEGKYFS